LIEASGLADRVQQIGYRSNPYPWIRRARATVCTSDFEGFPNVLVESLIVGTPCISTDCPTGPAEILAGTAVSKLVAMGDTAGFTRSMRELLESGEREMSAPILDAVRTESIVARYLEAIGLAGIDRGSQRA
jgi:glycosyltransferase involved in cell wall biosynthesis